MSVITIERKILGKNDEIAGQNRNLFLQHNIFVFNLVSSPGSGKTSILDRTLEHLAGTINVAVIEGDVQTDFDAQRVAKYNVPVVQIVTRGGCHLDANLIRDALQKISLDKLQVLIIENVGNLVCPAEFDTGAIRSVMILSVPEGDDKPLKYPLMFSVSDVLLINKIDYLGLSDFDVAAARERAFRLNPRIEIFEISAKTGQGMEAWTSWLAREASRFLGR
jgi:hydrogenase nickel incorporation protein HypB